MSVKKVYSTSTKKKPGWKFNAKTERYWSYGFDIRLSDGTRRRESGFASQTDAELAVASIRLAEKEKKYDLPRSSSAANKTPTLDALIKKKIDPLPETTYEQRSAKRRAETVLLRFAELLPKNAKVEDVTTETVEEYIKLRQTGTVKPSTINRELNTICACLNAAKTLFPVLKKWERPVVQRLKVSKRRRERIITQEESAKLFPWFFAPKRVGEDARTAISRYRIGKMLFFALLTGMRLGEIRKLRWSQIDFETDTIKIIGTKTDTDRYISPMSETMLLILKERRVLSETEFVFTTNGGVPARFYEKLRTACVSCGIVYGRDMEDGFRFHDARHTVTTRLLEAGVDIATVQSITGHADKTMVLYYSHPSRESRRRASTALENSVGWTKNGQTK